jgi:hypothetical protein
MQLAPVPQLPPTSVIRDATTQRVTVKLAVAPQVRPMQEAVLNLGGRGAIAEPHATPTSTLTFVLDAVDAGQQLIRLTVDGIESQLIRHEPAPPAFDPSQHVVVPA